MEYAQKESVNVIETKEQDIDRVLSLEDPSDQLREMAVRLFGKVIAKRAD
jgi:hypothetical protein